MRKSEKEKMLSEELYNASDPILVEERKRARLFTKRFNDSSAEEGNLRQIILTDLIGEHGENLDIEPPFHCDYGSNITLGTNVYFNFGCLILDVAPVTLGDNVLFGPGVQIYTVMHPENWEKRAAGLEFALPISIGANVWIGGAAIICPGIEIGDRSIIGAGSVVTKNVPPDVYAAGNPSKVIRKL
ncbi:MAG: sugar O-acetyltransferase [Balneolales bacterium]